MVKLAGSSRASWWALAGLTGVASAQACDGGPAGDTGGVPVVVGELLAAVGPEVVLPAIGQFLTDLDAMDDALEAWQSGTGTAESAQDAWSTTMELLQIGALGSSLSVIAGEDLRDEVYSWPTVNGCRLDQETVEEEWDSESYFDDNLVNAYGLDGLEHLLFSSLENSCPSQAEIDDEWATLGEAGILTNRQAFARSLSQGVRDLAMDLQTRWSPEGGNFSGQLEALTEDSPYASPQEALNAVFGAMFYLDKSTKDRKLAQPLGLMECSEPTCPEDVEGLLSGSGVSAIQANLEGLRVLFTGGDGTGFDDVLQEFGHEDVSEAFLTALDNALVVAEELNGPLDTLIREEEDQVTALHTAVKAITDVIKGDLATVLTLEIPTEASGDSD